MTNKNIPSSRQSFESIKGLKGNKAHQICRTYLGAYREFLSTYIGSKAEAKEKFAENLVDQFSEVFDLTNSSGYSNSHAVALHLAALLSIAEGKIKADKPYLEDLQDIFVNWCYISRKNI